jgi:hypothetical protein
VNEPAAGGIGSGAEGPIAPPHLPLRGLPLLIAKLRTGGLSWLGERLRDEWQMPRTGPGQALYRAVRSVGRSTGVASRDKEAHQRPDTLYAFYDLGVAPVTYDFLWFLVGAELERRRRKLASVHVVIVPGPRGGLRRETPELEHALNATTRRARIFSMLVPSCSLLPSLGGVTVAGGRAQAAQLVNTAEGAVFPTRYEPALPAYPGPQEPLRAAREERARVAALRAAPADSQAVASWLATHGCDRRVVTITLRAYDYVPARNSNIPAWAAFARGLDSTRFSVVVVPDSEQCFTGIPAELHGMRIFSEAALAPGLRMALYQSAYLNLGVNNGPMGLCWLNAETRYITFKILNDAAPQTSADYMKFLGFEIGRSLPFASPWQRWVWAEDELPVIEDAFADMVARLENTQAAPNSAA